MSMGVAMDFSDLISAMAKLDAFVESGFQEIMMEHAEEAVAGIQGDWPRDTGLSGDSFRAEFTPEGVAIVNPVEYTQYVHRSGDTEPAFDQIVGPHVEAATSKMVRDADEIIHSTLKTS
jgi:hypothetical protein